MQCTEKCELKRVNVQNNNKKRVGLKNLCYQNFAFKHAYL